MELKEVNITKSDLQSFNCTVGRTTNYSTIFDSMICNFEKDSEEHNELINRKKTLRRYIGDSIDQAKGIKTKKFPRSWKTFIKFDKEVDSEELLKQKYFQNKLVAKKKPYFMTYIYDSLMNDFRTYTNSQKLLCYENYGLKLSELKEKNDKTPDEKEFLKRYYKNMPVTLYNCIVNKLSWYIDSVDKDVKYIKNLKVTDEYIDKMINKNIVWNEENYNKTKELFKEFCKEKSTSIKNNKISNKLDKVNSISDEDNNEFDLDCFYDKYRDKWIDITSDEKEFANYALKVSYKANKCKDFVWCIAFDGLIENLKNNFPNRTIIPIECDKEEGVEYLGRYYKLKEVINDNIQRETTCDKND